VKRTLTGIQPSGEIHLGNYFGAIEPCLRAQNAPDVELMIFIADYHALTTVRDGAILRDHTLLLAKTLLSLGIDPEFTTIFRQSDVPEVTELSVLLSMVTSMGLLQRAHSYKDKVARGITPNVGLFYYPVLMAADILAYQTQYVPVGADQVQHIEIAQDIAEAFNRAYSYAPTFQRPEAVLTPAKKIPGLDGQKMSKSYGNTIPLFEEGDDLRNITARIKTQSIPYGEPLPTEDCSVLTLLELFAKTPEETEELRSFFRTGRRGSRKFGYGDAKELLAEKIENHFKRARETYLLDHCWGQPEMAEQALSKGAAQARQLARKTLEKVRTHCGLG
jgi:tryptophanyl-tRNA synthetase